jgi:hypothetical protein
MGSGQGLGTNNLASMEGWPMREQQLIAAIVRILKREGGSMYTVPLADRVFNHMILRPTIEEVQSALDAVVASGVAVYRDIANPMCPGNDRAVVWLAEYAPPVSPANPTT